MKNLICYFFLMFLLTFCSTTNNLYDEVFDNALIGENEMMIYARLGPPTRIMKDSNGGKIMMYEFNSKGMFLTPYKSALKYNANTNAVGEREGWTYTFGEYTAANDPRFTIYQKNVSYFKVFLDKHGKCTRYEQNLPREQLDIYHERFKHFNTKN